MSVVQLGTRQQRAILATMTPQEQATSIATMSPREQATALAIMSPRQQATTLARMSPDEQASILSIMSPRERGAALATMSPRNEHAALEVLSSIRSSSNPSSAGWSACKGPSGSGTGLSVQPLNLAEVTNPITPMQDLPVIGADSHEINDTRSNYASLFLEDALSQRDAKLRLAISSRSTTTQSLLLPLFMLVNAPAYGVGFDCAFIAGMLICWTDVNWTVVEIMLLLFLVADVITSIILSRMISNARGDARMKRRKKSNLTAFSIYVLLLAGLVFSCCVNQLEFDRSVNYVLPIMFLLHSPALWPEMVTFVRAVVSAGPAAHLWAYILIVASAMMVVLLNGKFTSGDYFVDRQFADFYQSISTLSIYMLGMGTYIELVEPSLDVNGAYIFIWIMLAILGCYLMVSLLLQFFGDTYAAKSDQQQKAGSRRKEWCSLSLTFMMSGYPPEEVMKSLKFDELISGSSVSPTWLGTDFTHKLHSAIVSISESDSPDLQELAALATICSDLNEQDLFQSLMDLKPESSRDLRDCIAARREAHLPAVLARSGLCTADLQSQIEYVQSVLGSLDDQQAEILLTSTSIPLMFDIDSMQNLTAMQGVVAGVVAGALKCQHQWISVVVHGLV